ncbi:MAG TPA: cytochrome c [Solirubrobacteraceae bacterium]|jgi:mono/diheme cytochrome c family protein|nr:cytochrome c [Solirubrobacteraceae bacterium]
MSPVRATLVVLVALVLGCAATGIGMGEAPAERERAPSAAQIADARQRVAGASASVRRGRELFASEGCDRCHSIAAIGAGGKLGPRLDTLDKDADEILESITAPRDEITDGYPEKLMPADFATRLDVAELQALADFVATVSGGEAERGDDGGRGRGRGRSGGD